MLASLLIVFREVLEAGLIVGIVVAATRGLHARGAWVTGGVCAGVVGAGIVAAFAGALSDAFSGNGQEVFNAGVLLIAVIMLGWHNLWMASHARVVARQIQTMGQEVSAGSRSLLAVAIVVMVAVLREGSEVVLFLYGIAASSKEGWGTLLAGGALGIGAGAVLSWLIYRGLLAIPVGRLFDVTSWLVALLAAGMAGQAAALLAGVDLIPTWGSQIWDTSWLIDEGSIVGRALRALIGYSDRPMGVQLVAFVVVLAVLVVGARLVRRAASAPREPGAATRAAPR
jgi:high-affinity iron transporter